ncbi:MAG TPA: histidinol-phosphate transaminase [Clostridiaceae bacterium]|nr:histidinol-phosphate transaminase [Clostridiaceae bacterium]
MNIYWSDTAKRLEPYVPGEQPQDRKYIKLNTNENPYPPSPKVLEAIKNAADDRLRLYPDPDCNSLKEYIAQYFGLEKGQVFVGNGSDEILAFAFLTFFNPGNSILFPDITYSFYPVYCGLYGINYKTVPLDENFSIPVESFFQKNGGIIIANPNAPTGKYLDVSLIRQILERNTKSVVLIDEAYIDFGGESSVKLVNEYPNLLVVQTLSKSRSLAGLRVGFALGDRGLIEGLDRVKNSFNSYTLDRLAIVSAIEAIKDETYFRKTREKVIRTRERVSRELTGIGFEVVDSLANFIFIRHPKVYAYDIFQKLREQGILVRHFNKPGIDNFLRVSIGTDSEMDIFLRVIKNIVRE